MTKSLFITIFLSLFSFAAFSQESKIQLTEKASIIFPEKPDVRNMQDIATVYSLKLADSSANFFAIIQDLEKNNGLTADQLEAAQAGPDFWLQLESSFVAQLGSETQVLTRERKKLGANEVLILVLSTLRNGNKMEVTSYVFIAGVYSINIIYNKRSDNASVDIKNNFFNSLIMTK
jgi:hypothetical protein